MRRFEISLSTFDLQPPSSLFKLNGSAGSIEYRIEKLLRVEESSLDPLSRLFPLLPRFPRSPSFHLPFHATMQNQSITPLTSTPDRPQAVAALLPEEIIDSILLQLGYDYSTPAWFPSQSERAKVLSIMSVVAEGWTEPARRLLFRTVRVETWANLKEPVGHGVGKQVRRLEIGNSGLDGVESGEIGRAIVELLKKLPNLRQLSLVKDYGRPPFDHIDFSSMRSTVFLPQLSELEISDVASPRSIIFNLLATSGHRIHRLSVHCHDDGAGIDPLVTGQQLDFRGNLRYLSTYGAFYQTMLDPTQVALDGLVGLEELRLPFNVAVEPNEREGGFLRAIGSTLRTLTISSTKAAWLTDFATPLSSLIRLNITNSDASPLPFFRRLPPALTSLQFGFDDDFHAAFALWTATPALVPASLKSIEFSIIRNITTFQQLPRVDTLQTLCTGATVGLLRQLSPGLPFKTLAMFISEYDLAQLSLVEAECLRLGVTFRQRMNPQDD